MTNNEHITHPEYWIDTRCTGNAKACKRARREECHVHIIPRSDIADPEGLLVLPTYHYSTVERAIAAYEDAKINAIKISSDAQLYDARQTERAYKLPVGWIDPDRRNESDWRDYANRVDRYWD